LCSCDILTQPHSTEKGVTVAIIAERSLFGWEDVEELGDLQRLHLVLKYLPDEELMEVLEGHRDRGRNDYPLRPMWNSLIAGVVFEHPSIASLRRELRRNAQLRDVCGFDLLKGMVAVPSSWNYTRFLHLLIDHYPLIERMFHRLVEGCREVLPDLGKILMIDGTSISSYARREGKREGDGRGDRDADWAVHEYSGVHTDGRVWQRVKRWFGYTLHLVVDAEYELPVGFKVTKASRSEMPVAHEIVDELAKEHGRMVEGCEYLGGERGYDDGKLIRRLWDDYGIKPVIDIRNCRADGDEGWVLGSHQNIFYNYRGEVSCVCYRSGEQRSMAYGGFEKARGTLKYRCPARHYGFDCKSAEECGVGGAVRIALSEDRRIFTPLARSSYAWKRIYSKRTAVERVNSRLDGPFSLDRHFIRGLAKMRLKCSLSLCVMLAAAIGRIKERQQGLMRSFLKAG
jgi:hypothetical protein